LVVVANLPQIQLASQYTVCTMDFNASAYYSFPMPCFYSNPSIEYFCKPQAYADEARKHPISVMGYMTDTCLSLTSLVVRQNNTAGWMESVYSMYLGDIPTH
jgi:hypothetical protein